MGELVMNDRERGAALPFWEDALGEGELAARWAVWSVDGCGPVIMSRLLAACDGELRRVWRDGIDWSALRAPRRTRRGLQQLLERRPEHVLDAERGRMSAGSALVYIGHELYPPALLDLDHPPCFVTIAGDPVALQLPRRLSLVGSRDVGVRHEEFASRLVEALAAQDCVIVSGGARGLDTIAHEVSNTHGATTIAVMPGGLGQLVPRRNSRLFDEIVECGGALISEYPWDVAPRKHHYARRNHLIAALGQGLVVLRAGATSGTMLSADAATALGRPICALPYDADDEHAAGSRTLIRCGRARLVSGASDIMADVFGELVAAEPLVGKARQQELCLGVRGEAEFELDDFARARELESGAARAALLELELAGEVVLRPGGRYAWAAR